MGLKHVTSVKTDTDLIHLLSDHIHSKQLCSPNLADPITVTSGTGIWTLGNYSADLIATNAVNNVFDIHHVVISDPDANEDYDLVLYGE